MDYFILPLLGISNFNAADMIKSKTKQNFNATDQPEFQTNRPSQSCDLISVLFCDLYKQFNHLQLNFPMC